MSPGRVSREKVTLSFCQMESVTFSRQAGISSFRRKYAIVEPSPSQAQVREAENTEDEHLRKVRAWVAAARSVKP